MQKFIGKYYSVFLFALLAVYCQGVLQLPNREIWKIVKEAANDPEVSIIELKGLSGTGKSYTLQTYFESKKNFKYINLIFNRKKMISEIIKEGYRAIDEIKETDAVKLVEQMKIYATENIGAKFVFCGTRISSASWNECKNERGKSQKDFNAHFPIRYIVFPPLTITESGRSVNSSIEVLQAIRKGGLFTVQNYEPRKIKDYFNEYFYRLNKQFNRLDKILDFTGVFKIIVRLYFSKIFYVDLSKQFPDEKEIANTRLIKKFTDRNLIAFVENPKCDIERKLYVMDTGILWYVLQLHYANNLKLEDAEEYMGRLVENLVFTEFYYRLVIYDMESLLQFFHHKYENEEFEIDFYIKFRCKIYLFEVKSIAFYKDSKNLDHAVKSLKKYHIYYNEVLSKREGIFQYKIENTYVIHLGESFDYNVTFEFSPFKKNAITPNKKDTSSTIVKFLSLKDLGSVIDDIVKIIVSEIDAEPKIVRNEEKITEKKYAETVGVNKIKRCEESRT